MACQSVAGRGPEDLRTVEAMQGDLMETNRTIAYFSMEIGLEVGMPTYSGGLGVLAGDTIRAAADLNIPMVAVTLLHRQGYFSPAFVMGRRPIQADHLPPAAAMRTGDHSTM